MDSKNLEKNRGKTIPNYQLPITNSQFPTKGLFQQTLNSKHLSFEKTSPFMKHHCLQLLRKITLISILSVLLFSTTSCANNQTNAPQVETTPTPNKTTNPTVKKLPKFVKSQVLSNATKHFTKPVTDLRIIEAEKQNWGDSCLGLAEPGRLCAQVIVPGWKVVVSDGQNKLVYRTDEKGKQVKLENSQK